MSKMFLSFAFRIVIEMPDSKIVYVICIYHVYDDVSVQIEVGRNAPCEHCEQSKMDAFAAADGGSAGMFAPSPTPPKPRFDPPETAGSIEDAAWFDEGGSAQMFNPRVNF